MDEDPRGWYSRGYLPHIDAGSQPQYITFRLWDSLPAEIIEQWRRELAGLPDEEAKKEMFNRVERYLDVGRGSCLLKNSAAAIQVHDCLIHGHMLKYELHHWVVMPNHVLVLLTPFPGQTFKSILGPMKSYSSLQINRMLGREGSLWQNDFFDRLIRDHEHFNRVARYIEWNPVKAKLISDPSKWPCSSANEVAWKRARDKDQK